MLLNQLIAFQQNQHAELQAQIEELQEKQRQIQNFIQQLGSVESKMVSGIQVLQEAIISILEVCPGELAAYQQLISQLFAIPSQMDTSKENEATEASNITTESNENEPEINNTTESGNEVPKADDNTPEIVDTQESNDNAPEIGNTPELNNNATKYDATELIEKIKAISSELSWSAYKKFLGFCSLPEPTSKKSRKEIKAIFEAYLMNCETKTLFALLNKLQSA